MDQLQMTNHFQGCIDACQQCAEACEACLTAMIGMESGNDCPHCCRECVDICQLTALALVRNSNFAGEYCKICASVCAWCAKQCGEHEHDHCQVCAEACRRCMQECQKFAA